MAIMAISLIWLAFNPFFIGIYLPDMAVSDATRLLMITVYHLKKYRQAFSGEMHSGEDKMQEV